MGKGGIGGSDDDIIYSSTVNEYAVEQPGPGQVYDESLVTWLQDYRDFGAWHNGNCNILFADGSIRVFKDIDGDTFLNPGFICDTSDIAATGYASEIVELPPALIFSGTFLDKFQYKTNLD